MRKNFFAFIGEKEFCHEVNNEFFPCEVNEEFDSRFWDYWNGKIACILKVNFLWIIKILKRKNSKFFPK